MHTFTALFDQREQAEAAQAQLQQLGVIKADGLNMADQNTRGFNADRSADQKGFWGSLGGSVIPDDDRKVYEEGVRQGGYLLTVNVDEEHADRVHDLLERSSAVDVNEREEQYRKTGVLPPSDLSASQTSMGRTEGLSQSTTGEQSIPIVEENIRIGKREVSRGGMRVRSYVVETPVHEQVTLREEHVDIERRPVDQKLQGGIGASDDLLRERTVELTEMSEEAVVAKDARIVEEVVLRKDVNERVETIDDTIRRTEVDVERIDPKLNR